MKKLFTILFILFTHTAIHAATSIVDTTVSGHWTLSGSPYLIYNNIQLNYSDDLTIDPGVEVIFQGSYIFRVYGTLTAEGNADNRITFKRNDTTGWHNDLTTDGGWQGIRFMLNWGMTPDTSHVSYCDFTNMKNGNGYYIDARYVYTSNSRFYNNKHRAQNPIIFAGGFDSTYSVGFDSCEVFNNKNIVYQESASTWAVSPIMHFLAGNYYVTNCKIHDNEAPMSIWVNSSALIANSEIYNNKQIDSINGLSTINTQGNPTYGRRVVILNNKIYKNTSFGDAAISCYDNISDIQNNKICNNKSLKDPASDLHACALVQGGAGIRIQNRAGTYNTARSIIRNNIIANNHTKFAGAGVYNYYSNTVIANNHFINNKADYRGGAIYVFNAQPLSDSVKTIIKNNIFYGNEIPSNPTEEISAYQPGVFRFTHNWTQTPYSQIVGTVMPYVLYGDTATNIIGTNPGLTSVTTTTSADEQAIDSTFSLLGTSPCINSGDSALVQTLATDINGLPRIVGSSIDIGAHEYQTPAAVANTEQHSSFNIYPNPAANTIFIKGNDITGQLFIYDISGKVVWQQNSGNFNIIPTDGFANGIYIIKIKTNNQETLQQKVTVDK